MHVSPSQPTGSSLLARAPDWDRRGASRGDQASVEREIEVRRLDDIAGDEPGPVVLKIDVEGAELAVLGGARECLARTELVILEGSVTPRHAGESSLVCTAHYLQQQGFVLADIVNLESFGPHRGLAYVDAVFAPPEGQFLSRLRCS